MVYHTEDPVIVRRCFEAGARYVETDNIKSLAELIPEYFTADEQCG